MAPFRFRGRRWCGGFVLSTFFLIFLLPAAGFQSLFKTRQSGDYYTSDLIEAHIAVGPVAEARQYDRDGLSNRRIALTTEEIQREFAEGISDIHRAATVTRIGSRGGPARALAVAREQGADLLIMPRIDQLTVDEMGRNGLEPLAITTDVLLFPVTLGVALLTQGERAGLGYQYIPIHDVMVSMKMNLDVYRVRDGERLTRRTYPTYVDVKINKDNMEGSRLDSTDDLRDVGRQQGRFAIREFAHRFAKEELGDLVDLARRSPND